MSRRRAYLGIAAVAVVAAAGVAFVSRDSRGASAGLAVANPGLLSQLERASYNAKLFPAGSTRPLAGALIPPGTSANNGSVVVYLEVPASRGTYTISGLVLDYHQGSTTYQATYPEQARICLGQTGCSSTEVTS